MVMLASICSLFTNKKEKYIALSKMLITELKRKKTCTSQMGSSGAVGGGGVSFSVPIPVDLIAP